MVKRERNKKADIAERISDYFLLCDAINDEKGKIVKPYTLSGLLCYLGISREEFEKMSKSGRHSKVLSNALAQIEAFTEENVLNGSLSANAGANSLKYNFGWGEKREHGPEEISQISVTMSSEASEFAM